MSDWLNIVSTVGFPIASFLLASLGIKYVYDSESEQETALAEKISTLAEAVAENTRTLAKLAEEIRDERE